MKLIIITPYFFPKMGGVEKYVYEMCLELNRKYNNELVVICSCWDNDTYKEYLIDNIKVYRLPFLFKISSTPINPFWYKRIESIIKKENPDVINGHIPVPYIADIAAKIACKNNIPFILTYHNDLIGYNFIVRFLSKFYYKLLGNRTLEISKKIIVTSDYYASASPYIKKYFNKTEIISPGVDLYKFRFLENVPKNDHTVLFVGQLNKESQHKGLIYLLNAIKIVKDIIPEIKVLIVGKGNCLDYYKKFAASITISQIVTFVGFVKDEDLPIYYNKSNVLILPSYNRSEGFGMVIIEAQACRTSVIGTSIGGIPYAIKNGETGLLVPPKDTQKLADAIIKILTDKNLQEKMIIKGYERVAEEFTWEKSGEKTEKIFLNISKSHR